MGSLTFSKSVKIWKNFQCVPALSPRKQYTSEVKLSVLIKLIYQLKYVAYIRSDKQKKFSLVTFVKSLMILLPGINTLYMFLHIHCHPLDVGRQSRGKLERVWPPPSKKDQTKSEQTQVMHQVLQLLLELWRCFICPKKTFLTNSGMFTGLLLFCMLMEMPYVLRLCPYPELSICKYNLFYR